MADISRWIIPIYESQLRKVFEDHPDKEEIIQGLKDKKYSFNDLDRIFAEAEAYSWKAFNERASRMNENGDNTITFTIES